MTRDEFNIALTEIQDLLARRASAGRGTLAGQLRRADPLLDHAARRAGRVIAKAQPLMDNPRTYHMVDSRALGRAFRVLRRALLALNPAGRTMMRLLEGTGLVIVRIVAVIAVLLGVIAARGLL